MVICLAFVSPFRVAFTLANTASYLHLQKESSIVKAQGTAAAGGADTVWGDTARGARKGGLWTLVAEVTAA